MEKKIIVANGVQLRLKNLKAPEVMAFLTVYGKGLEANDFEAIGASYERILCWLEAEVAGKWIAAYDKMSGQSLVGALNSSLSDPAFMTQLIELLEPFFKRSGE